MYVAALRYAFAHSRWHAGHDRHTNTSKRVKKKQKHRFAQCAACGRAHNNNNMPNNILTGEKMQTEIS